MKGNPYGSHRVISPKGLLPQAADKIDNDPEIYDNEILIDVIALQPTATAFGRIKSECGGDVGKIKGEIMKIVEDRGKFQDPVSKSGGILIGKIKEIGKDLQGKTNAEVGDKIATLVSLSLTPLKIYEITRIDTDTEQVYCRADAILFETGIYTKLPEDLGEQLSLAMMDVAGAPAQVAVHAKPGDVVVVEGAGKAGLLCLAEAKRRVAPTGTVVCMEYSAEQCRIVKKLGIADVVINANGQKPLESYDKYMKAMKGRLADFSVNTVSVPNTELSIIMVTKDEGMIYFFSMSTDFVKASLGAEGIKKCVPMLIGNGYYPGHADIAFDIVRQNKKVRKYFEDRYCK
ncbi:MAG: L-erythro-3,5-diaminohexanoate dehydrogenase [Oscillospiraceae bacterium]|nr:L-erythro-3,5-diaminohexanoate dehydrogenase [Oscillospiraceae bacterium]